VVTFEFDPGLAMTGTGTIRFPLYRPCGESGSLNAQVSFQDRCDTVRVNTAQGGQTTLVSNATLFATPQEYTLVDRTATWRFYVSSLGTQDAEDLIVTNTLPVGHLLASVEITGAAMSNVDGVIAGVVSDTAIIGGREVVTFTIPTLPIGGRLRFDLDSTVEDVCDEPPRQVDIALFDACGEVDGVCDGRDEGVVRL
jgi:hypothetical protein